MPAALHHKLAITLPAKWLDQSADKVKEAFVNAYNKKFPDSKLDDEEFVLSVKDASPFTNKDFKILSSSDTPGASFEDKGEVRLVPPPPSSVNGGVAANGKLRCKNFGCQQEYTEAENTDTACRHHVNHPMFHDTRKWWTCCDGVKVYSFDEMLTIPGCQVGRHSNIPPPAEQERDAEIKAATNKVRRALEGVLRMAKEEQRCQAQRMRCCSFTRTLTRVSVALCYQVLEMHMNATKPTAEGRAPAPKQDFTPRQCTYHTTPQCTVPPRTTPHNTTTNRTAPHRTTHHTTTAKP